jgi:uncharacterized protein YbbC (DUF1343 family)
MRAQIGAQPLMPATPPKFFRLRQLPLMVLAAACLFSAGCTHTSYSLPEETIIPAPVPVPAPTEVLPAPAPIPPAQATTPPPTPAALGQTRIYLGIDVLAARKFSDLQGLRVGLLTHKAGVNRDGVSTIDILRRAPGVKLVALFAPENGLNSDEKSGDPVINRVDQHTGLPVISLYNGTGIEPTAAMLKDIDVMVVDLQDIGTRSYTFISCLRKTMEGCFKQNKTVIVLDRPNPLGGLNVGGPMLESRWVSYVGEYPVPYVFGLTIGELARIAKETPGWLSVTEDVRRRGRLIIVPMSGWHRSMTWADTGLKWVPTSPRIPTAEAAFGYSLTGLGGMAGPGNIGHGIDTPYPFMLLNFPGHQPAELAAYLTALKLPGLSFVVLSYHDPADPRLIRTGVHVVITNWSAVQPTKLAFEMMKLSVAWSTNGNPFAKMSQREFCIYVGSTAWWQEITTKGPRADVDGFFRQWEAQDAAFQQQTKPWWIYPP